MAHFWEITVAEEFQASANRHKKGSKQHKEQKAEMEKLLNIRDDVRDAIIEKWITYCKVENGTQFLKWRLQLIKLDLAPL